MAAVLRSNYIVCSSRVVFNDIVTEDEQISLLSLAFKM